VIRWNTCASERVFLYDFLNKKLKESAFTYEIFAPIVGYNVFKPLKAKMIEINQFQIIEIPKSEWSELKVFNIKDFESIDRDLCVSTEIPYQIGDIVKCDLMRFYDYPSLVVTEKI
jgi:hypothetical protein